MLEGKVALVTGGTTGIGLEITRLLLSRGARIVMLARDERRGASVLTELASSHLDFFGGDIGTPETSESAVTFTEERFGRLDILVNNAGIDHYEPLLTVSAETSLLVLRINFHGALWMMQAAARRMTGRGGSIVNVTSRLASVGVPGMSIYGAAKGALSALTRGAAIDLAPQQIRVNAVAPGFTETPLLQAWLDSQPSDARDTETASIPLNRLGQPADVAAAVAFLASDEAKFITGATLAVDGGYTAR